MNIKIISPQKIIYTSNEVKEAFFPTTTGVIEVLPEHMNLISSLQVGEIRIKNKSEKGFDTVLISKGLLEVKDDDILILADNAALPSELVKEEIEEALRNAQEKIASPLPPTELILIEKEIMYHKLRYNKLNSNI